MPNQIAGEWIRDADDRYGVGPVDQATGEGIAWRAANVAAGYGDGRMVLYDSGGASAAPVFKNAAALADALANPTVGGMGAFGHGFNGTTWDRLRSAAGIASGMGIAATLFGATGTTPLLPNAAALSDALANPTTTLVGAAGLLWSNGATTWVRDRNALNNTDGATGGTFGTKSVMLWNGANFNRWQSSNTDAQAANSIAASGLMAYNGATYDRLRTVGTGILKVENSYTLGRATADTQIKASAGFVHTVSIAPLTATPTAGLLTVYDNTAGSGTVVYQEWVFATTPGHTVTLDVACGTGIYVEFDATLANVQVIVAYR